MRGEDEGEGEGEGEDEDEGVTVVWWAGGCG